MISKSDIPGRLRAILALIDGMLEETHGQAFDHIAGNFLYERAVERVIELIDEAAEPLPAALGARYPAEELAPALTLADKLLDNDYRIDTYDLWQLLTKQFPALRLRVVELLADFDFEI